MQAIRTFVVVLLLIIGTASAVLAEEVKLLNVSYDPTREFYQEFNAAFSKYWKGKSGQDVVVDQSHGGSGKQARAIVDGLEADVATLALSYDVDQLYQRAGLIPKNWQERLPDNSAPYTSTIVFLVRAGNPKNIKDWDDLARSGVSVITPNPKTSGGARWNYLAAWAYGQKKFGGDEAKTKDLLAKIFKNVPVLDTGARGSTTTFIEREIGDVFISWENEAFLASKELGKGKFQIIVPSISILAEPSVTVVDKIASKHGTKEVAEEYLKYLYTEQGQEIAAKNYYRPRLKSVATKYAKQFPKINLITIDEEFGGWKKAQDEHFGDGGTFDQIIKLGKS